MSHGQPGKSECQLRLHMDALHVQQRQAPASCSEAIQSHCVAALHAHEGGNVQSKNRSCLPRVPQNLDIQNVQHMTCLRFIELPEEGTPSQSSTIFALNDHLRYEKAQVSEELIDVQAVRPSWLDTRSPNLQPRMGCS